LVLAPPTDPVGLRDRAAIELMYGSGLRVAELCALDVTDVDVDGQRVRIMGKGSKARVVPIGDFAREAVRRYLDHGSPAMMPADVSEALLFNRRRRRLSPRDVDSMVDRDARMTMQGGKVRQPARR